LITVITPTIRPKGLEIVDIALKRQTFRDFEWLVGSPTNTGYGKWVKDNFKGGVWTLNRIYNKLIKKAKGNLIVSWQDYTFADPDCLEKFYFHFNNEPKTLVSGVGNKYTTVYPELGAKIWQDPRERDDQGTFYSVYPSDIEWNLASIPKQSLYNIGGFDEALDYLGYGLDGFSVNYRVDDLKEGYDFKIDQTIKSYSLAHGRADDWEEKNLIHGGYNKYMAKLKAVGKYPKLEYLK